MPRSSTPRGAKPKGAQAFTKQLLAWYTRAARDLPWRRTRDPYRVLVSEVMLQQTQVSRVTEYYPRFIARFPDLETLASARPKAVREAWDGLGYYARARNLHALAKQVSGAGGQVPEDPEELIKLPGVGRYTAGAVACFAYERPVPAVDTNVARVIRRVFLEKEGRGEWGVVPDGSQRKSGSHRREPLPTPHASRNIWNLARALIPKDGKRAWRFNQAMMELGAIRGARVRCAKAEMRRVPSARRV